jgi:hypothetical protein
LTGKCFPLTNISNGKQTQESLESGFPEIIFQETNTAEIYVKSKFTKSFFFKQLKEIVNL